MFRAIFFGKQMHDGNSHSAPSKSYHDLKILDRHEIAALIPYSIDHITRLEKVGKFPRRIRLGPSRVGWLLTDVQNWIQNCIESPADEHTASQPEEASTHKINRWVRTWN